MKATEVRAKTPDELKAMLLDLRKEQFNLRFQRATGQAGNVARVRQVRRDIARVKTIMRERAPSASRTAPQGATQVSATQGSAPAGATQS